MKLSKNDQEMLEGRQGKAVQIAMSILVRMAEVLETDEMMDISQAHIDGCGLLSESSLEFSETLAAHGARVKVPTTLSMGPLDLRNWRRFGVDESFAQRAIRQAEAYESMGCVPAWTCAPYQGYLTPRFGRQIAWGESNAVVYANSVLGARTNRYGDYMDICAAITGRVPKCGLHLDENRLGQTLLRLTDLDPALTRHDLFYPTLGHLIGAAVGEAIPVIEGLPADATDDQLKALGAAAASAGAVALFHAIGLTPEAPTQEAAFGGREPERIIEVGMPELREAWGDLSAVAPPSKIDAVVLGCPHYSFAEFVRLAECIRAEEGKVAPGVTFLVVTGEQSHALLQRRKDLVKTLDDFGVQITLDTCVFHSPILKNETKVILTDSGKCAYYAPGELGVEVAFGSVADCARSAIAGRLIRHDTPFDEGTE